MRESAGDIESVQQAVTRLGRKGLREVVSAAIVSPLADFGRDARLDHEALRWIWPQTLQAAVNVKTGAQYAGIGDRSFVLYLAALAHSTGLMVLLRGLKDLRSSEVSSDFVGELERIARQASVGVARGWEFGDETVAVLQDWADGDVDGRETAVLSRAIEFARIRYLCRGGHLDPEVCEAYRDTLPDYARGWACRLP